MCKRKNVAVRLKGSWVSNTRYTVARDRDTVDRHHRQTGEVAQAMVNTGYLIQALMAP